MMREILSAAGHTKGFYAWNFGVYINLLPTVVWDYVMILLTDLSNASGMDSEYIRL